MRLLQPLRHRAVALLWSGLALSAVGDQLYAVALTWIAVGVLGAGAGYLGALQSGCILLSVLFAGHWVDRHDKRRVLLIDYLVEALALAIVVAAWVARGSASPVLLVLVVAVLSVGIGITRPTVQAILPELLPDPAQLPAANALIDSTERIARLAGPFIIGALAGVLPEKYFLTLDALSFAVAAVAAALLPAGRRLPGPAIGPVRDAGAVARPGGVLRGFEALRRDALLQDCWRTAAIGNGAWIVTFFLCVPLAIERAGVGGLAGSGLGAFGLVIGCYGLTSSVALLVVGNQGVSRQPAGQIIAARFLMAAGMVVVGITSWLAPPTLLLPGFVLGAMIGAPAGPIADVPIAYMRQTRMDRTDVAPVVRAFIATNQVGNAAGLLAAPLMIRWLGIPAVLAACTALSAGVGLYMLVRRARYAPV